MRKVHYLGRDRRQATLDAILIDQRWDKVKADHKAMLARLSPVLGRDYCSLPLWPSSDCRWNNRRACRWAIDTESKSAGKESQKCW